MGRRLSVLLPLAGALLALALVIGFPQLGGVLAPARAQVVLTLTVSASPNPLNTGTGNFSTVTVTATDPFSQPVSGVQIQLTSSRPTEDTITAVNATTNASGQATFQVSSRTVGTSTLTASDTPPFFFGNTTLTVQTQVSTPQSTITTALGNLLINTTRQITVTARDSSNNPLQGQYVELTVSPSGATLIPTSNFTAINGEATFNFSSGTPGNYTVSATVAGVSIGSVVINVTGVNQSASTVALSPSTVLVGQAANVLVTVTDTGGQPVVGAPVNLVSSRPGNDTVSPSSATTNASGQASFTVTSNAAGTSILTAIVNGIPLTNTATLIVRQVSPTNSSVTVTPPSVFMGETRTVTVNVRDLGNTPIQGVLVTLTSNRGAIDTITPVSPTTDVNGNATFNVTSNTPGTATLTAVANSVTITPSATLQVTQIAPAASTISPTIANVVIGSPLTVTVTVVDTAGVPVSGAQVTLSASLGFSGSLGGTVTTSGTGVANFTVTPTAAGSYTISATAVKNTNIQTLTGTLTLNAVTLSSSFSTMNVSPASVAVNVNSTVTVTAVDNNGLPVQGANVTLTGVSSITPASAVTNASGQAVFSATNNTAGTFTLTANITKGSSSATVTGSLTVTDISSTLSTVQISPTTKTVVGVPRTVTVIVRNTLNQLLPGVLVSLSGSPSGLTFSAPTTSDASGVATFTVMPTATGLYTITATAGSVTISNTVGLIVLQVDPNLTTVTVSPTTVPVSVPATVTVTVRDTANDLVPNVPVSLTAPGLTISPAGAFSNASGVATFTVTRTTTPGGTFTINATANSIAINNTATLLVTSINSGSPSSVSVSPASVFVGVPATVTVTVFDTSSNPVVGVPVTISSTPAGITGSGTTGAGGVANITVSTTTPGTYTIQATAGATTLTQTASLTVNGVSGSFSTFTVSPTSVFAGTPATVTVNVKDTANNSVPAGVPVTITSSPAGITGSGTTNASGVATITVSTTTPGAYTLQATAGGTPITSTAPVLTVNGISNILSTISIVPNTITVGGSTTVTVTVKDTANQNVSGATVILSSNRPSNDTITPLSATTNASGQATFTVISNAVGTSTLSYTANSISISNTGTLTVVAGPDLGVTKTSSGTFSVNAQGTFQIAVTNLGGPVNPGSTITVTDTLPATMNYVSASGPGFSCSFAAPTVTCTRTTGMNTSETATINLEVIPTLAGSVTNTVTVSLSGQTDTNSANNSASHTVVVQPPTPQTISPTFSTVTVSPTSVPADNVSAVNVLVNVRNTSNQPVNGAQVSLLAVPNTGLTILAAPTLNSDINGNVAFAVRSSVPQTVNFSVSITAANNVLLTGLPPVTFTLGAAATPTPSGTPTPGGPLVISETNSTVISNFNSIPADNQTVATITVTLRSTTNQPVPGKQVTLRVNPALATVLIQPTSGTTDANGVVSFSVRASAQGQATFSAEAVDDRVYILTQTATIQFTAPGTQPVPNPQAQQGQQAAQRPASTLTVPTGELEGRVVAFRLRVRTGPGLEFPVLGLLAFDTRVSIVGRNVRGTWYQIQIEGGTGWVSARWVRVSRAVRNRVPVVAAPGTSPILLPPSSATAGQGEGVGVVNTFLLRVRTGPGTQFQQIGLLREGTEIVIIGVSRDRRWYLFRTAEGTAWTSALFVRLKFVNGDRLPLLNADGTPVF